ncbi:MAG TPA: hypothetical protein DIS90_09265, partial [Cytophagales bacterium]|nr:hypothetical protein [Cytophagales bacterium]
MDSSHGAIVFLGKDLIVKEGEIEEIIRNDQAISVWYDERATHPSGAPRVTQLLSPGIYFNLPLTSAGFSIWNISLDCLVIKKEVIHALGFLNPSFTTVEGAMVDWIYRLLYGGALMEPVEFLQGNSIEPKTSNRLTVADEFRYI